MMSATGVEVITLLDTKVYKGATFHKESILDVQTYYKPTANFYSCHPPSVSQKALSREKHEGF